MDIFRRQKRAAREAAFTERLGRHGAEYDAARERLSGAIGFLGTGHLDTSAERGYVADRIIVQAEEGDWHFPLKGGIDVVDAQDGKYIEESFAHVGVSRRQDGQFVLEARWTGTDDENRGAEVDLRQARFVPKEQ